MHSNERFSLRHLLMALLGGVLMSSSVYAAGEAAAQEEGLEYLLFQDIPVVVSVSKKAENVSSAPSNVTVITDKQIKAMGLRDIKDVLRLVPGYQVAYDRDEWVWAARGILGDNTFRYLLLIDGQDITTLSGFGVGEGQGQPNDLSNVKQVEVIRGPGSVVWGSSALAGVVNIVTKSASDLNGKQHVTATFGTENTKKLDFQAGQEGQDYSFIFDGTFYESDGTDIETDASTTFPILDTSYGTGRDPFGRYTTALDRYEPSYRLHLKGKAGNFHYDAYSFRSSVWNRQIEVDQGREVWFRRKMYFTRGGYEKTYGEDFYVDAQVSLGKLGSEYFTQDNTPIPVGRTAIAFASSTDEFIWSNIDFRKPLTEKLSVEGGVEFVHKYLDRVAITPLSVSPPVSGTGSVGNYIPNDDTSSAYAMLNVGLMEHLNFSLGGRAEYNTKRGNDAKIFTPRSGLVFEPTENSSYKLLYTTGYRRPDPTRPQADPELIEQYDFVYLQKMGAFRFTTTLFWQEISDLVFLPPTGGLGSNITDLTAVNAGSETAKGVEFEVSGTVWERHSVWMNLSYNQAEAGGYPSHIASEAQRTLPNGDKLAYLPFNVNLGGTFYLTDSIFVSPTVRWQDAIDYRTRPAVTTLASGTYTQTDSIAYVDLNIGWEQPEGSWSVMVYGNNIMDNRDLLPHAIRNGTYEPYGRYWEAKVGYGF